MMLKTKLNDLLANDKLAEAIDLLMDKIKNTDQDTYNTLILLKSRQVANDKENNMGIIARGDYQRTKAKVTYAFQQTIERVSKNIMESDDIDNQNQTSNTENFSTQKEIANYQQLLDLVIGKRLFLEKELITAYDSEKKFALQQQIKSLEEQISGLKQKVSADLQGVSSNYDAVRKSSLISMDSKIEQELHEIKKMSEMTANTKTNKSINEQYSQTEYNQRKINKLRKEIEDADNLKSEWKTKMLLAENPTEIKRCEIEIDKLQRLIKISEDELNQLGNES